MTSKNIQNGTDSRAAILRGALTLSKAVAVTYGPHGRNVLLDRPQGLISTRDGVTVAREVELDDPIENLGAQILKDASITVNDAVGDGTTTTVILAAELLREGHRLVAAGYDPLQLAEGMRDAAAAAVENIQKISVKISDQPTMESVALLSSNGDEIIAKYIAEASMAIGKDGTILIEDGNSVDCSLELKEGMEIDRGAVSPYFLEGNKDSRLEKVLKGPLVAVINRVLKTFDDIKDLLEVASQWKPRGLLIISHGVEGDAISGLAANNLTGKKNSSPGIMDICPVNCPGFGPHKADYLKDIAALSGATFVDPDAGYDITKWEAEWFGAFHQATIKEKTSTFISYDTNMGDLKKYLSGLRLRAKSASSDYDRDRILERMAKLSGGLAIIKIGGVTEAALKERRARVEDALAAVNAALQGGIVPGAGNSLLRAATYSDPFDKSDTYLEGWKAFRKALLKPTEILASNAGQDGAHIAAKALTAAGRDSWMGWDVSQGKMRNLKEAPMIIDPFLVTKSVINSAVSVVTTLLTVEVSITDTKAHLRKTGSK